MISTKKAPINFHGLAEVGDICSLIFLPYSSGLIVGNEETVDNLVEAACKVERGFGQYVMTAFHPSDRPGLREMLAFKGWKQLAEWPSGHPVPEGTDYHMELWGKLTGQDPH